MHDTYVLTSSPKKWDIGVAKTRESEQNMNFEKKINKDPAL